MSPGLLILNGSLVTDSGALLVGDVCCCEPQPPTGACCDPNGNCTETTPENCTGPGFSFFPGIACADIDCILAACPPNICSVVPSLTVQVAGPDIQFPVSGCIIAYPSCTLNLVPGSPPCLAPGPIGVCTPGGGSCWAGCRGNNTACPPQFTNCVGENTIVSAVTIGCTVEFENCPPGVATARWRGTTHSVYANITTGCTVVWDFGPVVSPTIPPQGSGTVVAVYNTGPHTVLTPGTITIL